MICLISMILCQDVLKSEVNIVLCPFFGLVFAWFILSYLLLFDFVWRPEGKVVLSRQDALHKLFQ